MMNYAAIFLVITTYCLLHAAKVNGDKRIRATGGGVVKPGNDLVLSYSYGEVWDRCYWAWNEVSYCYFDLDPDTLLAKKRKCSPKDFGASMDYTGKNETECQVTIRHVTAAANGNWSARVDADLLFTRVEVVVASPVEDGEIMVENKMRAGEESPVVCKIHGGRPAPSVSLKIEGMTNNSIVNDSQTQEPDKEGNYETVQTLVIIPTAAEHGKIVSCQAVQFDKESKQLFEAFDVRQVTLNVSFPPQPMAAQVGKGNEGGSANISFVFTANPMPTVVKWIITEREADGNGTELGLGVKNDKYESSQLVTEEKLKYRSSLKIKSLATEDELLGYKLEVTNSAGMQTYTFTVKVEEAEAGVGNSSTAKPEPGEGESLPKEDEQGGSKAGLVFGILAVIAVICILLGSVYAYKKRQTSATAPLANSEVRK